MKIHHILTLSFCLIPLAPCDASHLKLGWDALREQQQQEESDRTDARLIPTLDLAIFGHKQFSRKKLNDGTLSNQAKWYFVFENMQTFLRKDDQNYDFLMISNNTNLSYNTRALATLFHYFATCCVGKPDDENYQKNTLEVLENLQERTEQQYHDFFRAEFDRLNSPEQQ